MLPHLTISCALVSGQCCCAWNAKVQGVPSACPQWRRWASLKLSVVAKPSGDWKLTYTDKGLLAPNILQQKAETHPRFSAFESFPCRSTFYTWIVSPRTVACPLIHSLPPQFSTIQMGQETQRILIHNARGLMSCWAHTATISCFTLREQEDERRGLRLHSWWLRKKIQLQSAPHQTAQLNRHHSHFTRHFQVAVIWMSGWTRVTKRKDLRVSMTPAESKTNKQTNNTSYSAKMRPFTKSYRGKSCMRPPTHHLNRYTVYIPKLQQETVRQVFKATSKF